MMRAVKSAKGASGEGASGEARPYLLLDKGLSALIKHAVFYEMAEIALAEMTPEGEITEGGITEGEAIDEMVLWSDGQAFALMPDLAEKVGQ